MERETFGVTDLKGIFSTGGVAALLQLAALLVMIGAGIVLGERPTAVQDFYAMYQHSKLLGILQDDLTSVVMIALYLGTFPALYFALRGVNPSSVTLATLFTLTGVAICFSTNTGLSLLYLSDQYTAAAGEAARAQILAAGEAVLAAGMWNSTGGYLAGILLQGAGVIISLVMLRSRSFSKVTAISGLLANAFDLTQHLLHPFAPSVSSIFIMLMGPFYLVWFPMLARDLLRLGRKSQASETAGQAVAAAQNAY